MRSCASGSAYTKNNMLRLTLGPLPDVAMILSARARAEPAPPWADALPSQGRKTRVETGSSTIPSVESWYMHTHPRHPVSDNDVSSSIRRSKSLWISSSPIAEIMLPTSSRSPSSSNQRETPLYGTTSETMGSDPRTMASTGGYEGTSPSHTRSCIHFSVDWVSVSAFIISAVR